jgi:beta-glucuronidase
MDKSKRAIVAKSAMSAIFLCGAAALVAPVAYAAPLSYHTIDNFPSPHLGKTEPMDSHIENIDGVNVLYQYGEPVPSFATDGFKQPGRQFISLDKVWRFQTDPTDVGVLEGWADPGYNDQSWTPENIPSSMDLYGTKGFGSTDGSYWGSGDSLYDGFAWFRTSVQVPPNWNKKFVHLNFLAVNYMAWIYVNGQFVGEHEGSNTAFSLDVSKYLHPGKNVIAVRVWRPNPHMTLDRAVPNGRVDYWPYGGIVYGAYLEATDQMSISKILTSTGNHTLSTDVVLYNHGSKTATRTLVVNPGKGSGGKPVSQTVTLAPHSVQVVKMTFAIPKAQWWTSSTPNLYTVTASLYTPTPSKPGPRGQAGSTNGTVYGTTPVAGALQPPTGPNPPIAPGGPAQPGPVGKGNPPQPPTPPAGPGMQPLDSLTTHYGMRTIGIADDHITLNGKPIFLKGFDWYSEFGNDGESITKAQYREELSEVHKLNANFIRNNSYPRAPFVYHYADRHGIMVMDEAPNMWLSGQGEKRQLTYGLSKALVESMVWNHENNPSIILWSMSDEVQQNHGYFKRWMSQLVDATKKLDVQNRPVTWCADPWHWHGDSLASVLGLNEYYGYFYNTNHPKRNYNYYLSRFHSEYPNKPILVTENGSWSFTGNGNSANTPGSQEWEEKLFQENWDVALQNDSFVTGYTYWVLKDYKTRGGYNQNLNGISTMGMLSFNMHHKRLVYTAFKDAKNPIAYSSVAK